MKQKFLMWIEFEYFLGKPKDKKKSDKSFKTLALVEDGSTEKDCAQVFKPKGVNPANCVITKIEATPVPFVINSAAREAKPEKQLIVNPTTLKAV
jgi:hypothetical protein